MNNELEKQFFDTFGIEKLVNQRYHTSIYGSIENCIEKAKEWSKENKIKIKNIEVASDESIYFDKVYYPQITDRILLELIRIIGKKPFGYLQCENTYSTNLGDIRDLITVEADDLKEGLLTLAMQAKVVLRIKHQVRTLFEEG